ncbi:MAG: HD domain-containing phosphohydrolase, partial [Planctomycetaceae bacterium]
QVKKHPLIGYDILSGLTNLQRVLPGVRNHHEHYNGQGYPDALSGDQIPFMARIIAVADSYDAMCKDRPYRAGMMITKVESILKHGRGKQWDPRVIDAYFRVREDIIASFDSNEPDAALNSGLIRLYGVSKRKFF